MVNIGVIGYGYWGPNLVRNFMEYGESTVGAVCDLSQDRLDAVSARYPTVKTTVHPADVIEDTAIDAVVVATPVSSHFDLTMKALQAGKHVLVEKPMAASVKQACRMVEQAEQARKVLMVDHTFVYTGAVRKIKELVEGGDLGQVYYYDSMRINLGLFQHDVNVIWDLAVHDLAIMEYVLTARPQAVSATGASHVAGQPVNTAYVTLYMEDGVIGHVNVNWLAPVKIRRTLIGGSRKMVVYDDLEPSEKVKVYDKGVVVSTEPEVLYRTLVGYRTGDMWAPQLDSTEGLRVEARHFVECIERGTTPLSDGRAGARVVGLLEAATRSMSESGRLVEVDPG
jgi:predicted dehydrogenase